MIELNNLEFSYTKTGARALSGVSASIAPGIYLVAGENGAGKTTLLHIIAGLKTPQVGECIIDGISGRNRCAEDMANIFLLEENMTFPAKSIRQFAKMHTRFYPTFSQEQFEANLHDFGLTGYESMKSLSTGMRKKSQLAYVLALGTKILLLDEPTNALDIEGRETLRKIIARSMDDERTLILSTHTVDEFSHLYDGAIILTHSHLTYAGTEEQVSSRLAFTATRIAPDDALYSEVQMGRILNIEPASPDDEPTRVDWKLLYIALHSPAAQQILLTLTQKPIAK